MEPYENEDLFAPSLQSAEKRHGARPWRLHSQLWVAFFGGSLAVAVYATLNSWRLNMSRQGQLRILVVGILAVVATLVTYYLFGVFAGSGTSLSNQTGIARLAARAIALIAYAILHYLQRSADRIYRLRYDDSYESAWAPGIAAVLVLGFIQAIAATAIITSVAGT